MNTHAGFVDASDSHRALIWLRNKALVVAALRGTGEIADPTDFDFPSLTVGVLLAADVGVGMGGR